jgi:hypothetical protein
MRTKKYGKRKNKTNRNRNINRKMKGGFLSLFNFKQTDQQIITQIDKLDKEKLAIDAKIQKLKEKLSIPAPQTVVAGPATAHQNGVAGPATAHQNGVAGPAAAPAGPSLNGKGPQNKI